MVELSELLYTSYKKKPLCTTLALLISLIDTKVNCCKEGAANVTQGQVFFLGSELVAQRVKCNFSC